MGGKEKRLQSQRQTSEMSNRTRNQFGDIYKRATIRTVTPNASVLHIDERSNTRSKTVARPAFPKAVAVRLQSVRTLNMRIDVSPMYRNFLKGGQTNGPVPVDGGRSGRVCSV